MMRAAQPTLCFSLVVNTCAARNYDRDGHSKKVVFFSFPLLSEENVQRYFMQRKLSPCKYSPRIFFRFFLSTLRDLEEEKRMRLSGPDDVASLINVPSLASGVDIHYYLASTETSMAQTRASLLKPNYLGTKSDWLIFAAKSGKSSSLTPFLIH